MHVFGRWPPMDPVAKERGRQYAERHGLVDGTGDGHSQAIYDAVVRAHGYRDQQAAAEQLDLEYRIRELEAMIGGRPTSGDVVPILAPKTDVDGDAYLFVVLVRYAGADAWSPYSTHRDAAEANTVALAQSGRVLRVPYYDGRGSTTTPTR